MSPTICLNMIVRNEAPVIRRCLDSVRPLIDSWCIVDTGSTDGTQAIIREHLRGVPGELFERRWKSFGHNRTEAIALARDRADYLLFMDADDVLQIESSFNKSALDADCYRVQLILGQHIYWRACLASTKLDWKFTGVLHEYLEAGAAHETRNLGGLVIHVRREGGRGRDVSEAEKYARDARTLEAALKDEPNNARYVFYLAQSYRDSGQPKKALAAYQKRAAMGGFEEEAWYAGYQAAKLGTVLGLKPAHVAQAFLDAYERRPSRAEPLVDLAEWYRERRQWALAHLVSSRAILIPQPQDLLFVETAAYSWRAIDEFAVASYWMGDFRACARACEQLLSNSALPMVHLARVTENLRLAKARLGQS